MSQAFDELQRKLGALEKNWVSFVQTAGRYCNMRMRDLKVWPTYQRPWRGYVYRVVYHLIVFKAKSVLHCYAGWGRGRPTTNPVRKRNVSVWFFRPRLLPAHESECAWGQRAKDMAVLSVNKVMSLRRYNQFGSMSSGSMLLQCWPLFAIWFGQSEYLRSSNTLRSWQMWNQGKYPWIRTLA